jgi:xylulokinase
MSTYANASWRVLGQMVSPIVPPGGSLGFDDKLFTFVWRVLSSSVLRTSSDIELHIRPTSEVHPFGVVDGHVRFENGISTTEFRDLRANPRCVRLIRPLPSAPSAKRRITRT